MKENNKTKIIVAIIGVAGTIIGAIGGNIYALNQQSQYIKSQLVNIVGSNNSVVINDIDDLVKEYNETLSENETLEAQNASYFNDLTEAKDKLTMLEAQLGDVPQISYKSLGLVLDAQDVTINKINSMATIDGKDYFSREITEQLLPNEKNLVIKDEAIFVGAVVADKANLTDQWEMSSRYCRVGESQTDSYGNSRSNTLYFNSSTCYIIYSLKAKYSLMKFTISVAQESDLNKEGILVIKADDTIVYTSKVLNKKTEPFTEIDIPINNCKLLTIEYTSDYNYCILSDVVLYN